MGTDEHAFSEETRDRIQQLAATGMNPAEIALYLDVRLADIGRHYANDIEVGMMKATVAVARKLYAHAMSEDDGWIDAAKFWLTQSGWKAHQRKGK
jgi:hypothetical protein